MLRPLLSVRWIERYGSAAPIEFEKLLHLIDGQTDLLAAIRELLAGKQIAPEMGLAQPVAIINGFIEDELNRLNTMNPQHSKKQEPLSKLNALFHSVLRESA